MKEGKKGHKSMKIGKGEKNQWQEQKEIRHKGGEIRRNKGEEEERKEGTKMRRRKGKKVQRSEGTHFIWRQKQERGEGEKKERTNAEEKGK